MADKLDELEAKITAELEKRLAEAISKRDAIAGPRGLKPPEFWTHQAEFISLRQQLARRKARNET